MKSIFSSLIALAMFVAYSANAQTAQLIVTEPSALAGSYAAVTYDTPPSNVTSTTPIVEGNFFVYDGVNCTAHTLTKPVAGSGIGKVALLTGSYPASCTYYDDIVRELQADGVVAVVFGFSNGAWRTRILHGNPAGMTVPVLYMQVDEISQSIRSAVLGGTSVAAAFVAVPGMALMQDVTTFLAGQTRPLGLVPLGSPSTGATWDLSSLDLDRTTAGIQQSYTFATSSACAGISYNWNVATHLLTATVPASSTYTGSCPKTYLIRDTAGYQGIGLVTLYIGVPFVRDDVAQTSPGVAVSIDVLANDAGDPSTKVAARLDLDPTTMTIDQTVTSAQGNWTIVGSNVLFTPAAGFIGVASVKYVVRGANGGSSNQATISVNVGTPDLNQHGLTGSWFEQVTSGQGVEVEVFPNPSSGTGSAFVSWFTYDTVFGGADHQRWYTAQGQVVTGQPSASLTIYQNTGGNFNAPPITTAQPVGTATLSFDTCSSGQLTYRFTDGTGRAGTIPLTRLTQNVTCATTTPHPTNADFALSGNWFGGAATSGQGFTVEVNPNSGAFFAAWYTYMPNGAAAGAAGQRWYTAQGNFTPGMRSIPATIYETTGGMFDTPTPPGQRTVPVGTGTMAFQNCSAATFSYNFTGGTSIGLSGTITLSRVGPVPPGCTS